MGLNKNVTKVREGNRQYIENILKSKHGSVLEHSTATFAFLNVSRIFTHEVVRHRAGCAFSQESMRFVRLDDIPVYAPDLKECFAELAEYQQDEELQARGDAWGEHLQGRYLEWMKDVTERAEMAIKFFSQLLDYPKVPFELKKKITSALRRMAPGGHSTNIIVTANHRAWRHMIELRTSLGAEEEIQKVFHEVAYILNRVFPNIYQDIIMGDQSYEVFFQHSKV